MFLIIPGQRFIGCYLLVLLLFTLGLTGCGSGIGHLSASIDALPSEDAAGPCRFDLELSSNLDKEKGVLVLYERGDTSDLYTDATVQEAARSMKLAVVWAHECNSKSTGDFQADAAQGPGRMLFAALEQFAELTGHSELNTNGIYLYGFSAAGVLTATMANDYPARLLGVVQYAAGSAYTDLDDIVLTPAAARIPALILANADDAASGTSRNYRYFQRGRQQHALWAYGVQNDRGHCCTISTRDVMLPWLQAVAAGPGPSAASAPIALNSQAITVGFTCTPDGVLDFQGETDCSFTTASVSDNSGKESGWLPDSAAGAAWLTWVTSGVESGVAKER